MSAAQSTGSDRVYTMEECLQIALNNNLDIRNAQEQLRSAGAEVTSAFGQFLPSVNVSAGYSRQLFTGDSVTVNFGELSRRIPTGDPDNYNVNLRANLTLFDGFNRESNYNRSKASLAATDLTAAYTRSNTLLTVRENYIAVLRAQQVVEIRREDVELAQKELERIKTQLEVGVVAPATMYAQEAEIGSKELAVVQAENELNIAKAVLLASMGRDPAGGADFIDASLPSEIPQTEIDEFRRRNGTYPTALKRAIEQREDLMAARKSREAAESSVTSAQSGYYPQVSANAGWTWSNTDLDNFSDGNTYIGLSLNIPVFNGFSVNRNIQTAEVGVQQRLIDIERIEQQIATELQRAYLQLASAEKELAITDRSLKSAEANFFSADERFKVGAGTILDYQTANNRLIATRIDRITAVYNYLLARYAVEFAVGDLD